MGLQRRILRWPLTVLPGVVHGVEVVGGGGGDQVPQVALEGVHLLALRVLTNLATTKKTLLRAS